MAPWGASRFDLGVFPRRPGSDLAPEHRADYHPRIAADDMPMTLPSAIRRRGAESPAAAAILAPGRPALTHDALASLLAATADALHDLGIRRDDRVASLLPPGPEAATAFLGVAAAAACAPLNPGLRPAEIEFALNDFGATALLVAPPVPRPIAELADRQRVRVIEVLVDPSTPAGTFALRPRPAATRRLDGNARPVAGPDDIALVLHTSGTTARPKIVPLTHGALVASAGNVADALALAAADRCLSVMPLFHIHGLVACLLAPLLVGGSLVAPGAFHAPSFFGWIDEFDPTWYSAVPTIHQAVLARAGSHPDITARRPFRLIRSSSSALPGPVLDGLEATFGCPVIEAYGMTEASHQMATNPLPPLERRRGSVGRAAGIAIAILDATGEQVPTGQTGEVAIRGATVFGGYERNPEANAAAFTDGWFRTGDEGTLDGDGYLHLRGRLKELINRGGEKVAPLEVEEVLLAHPAVARAVAFGVPDARLGEEVGVAVVPRDGATISEQEIQAFAAERLADYKVPRRVALVSEIPLGPTGKLQRIGLADRLGIAEAAVPHAERGSVVAPRTRLEQELAAMWCEVLGVDEVGVTDDYFALGGDSLQAAMIVTRIEARLGHRDLPLATFLWAPTIERYAASLESGTWGRDDSVLLPIKVGGTRPPLFFVYVDAELIGPVALRDALHAEQPFYALRALGLGDNAPAPSIESLSSAFVEAIREIQPEGPYLVGGFCTGGRVAIEMARSLIGSGDKVDLLVLVDPRVDEPRRRGWMLRGIVQELRGYPQHARNGALGAAVRRDLRLLRAALRGPGSRPRLDREAYVDELLLSRRNQPLLPFPGPMTVLHTVDFPIRRDLVERAATEVHWQALGTHHATAFQGEDGRRLAAGLEATLSRALESA
jgi:acyl-CoA synthetase (AMP-forming)/AMP-acid ligase II/thioesterase domain-containing protein